MKIKQVSIGWIYFCATTTVFAQNHFYDRNTVSNGYSVHTPITQIVGFSAGCYALSQEETLSDLFVQDSTKNEKSRGKKKNEPLTILDDSVPKNYFCLEVKETENSNRVFLSRLKIDAYQINFSNVNIKSDNPFISQFLNYLTDKQIAKIGNERWIGAEVEQDRTYLFFHPKFSTEIVKGPKLNNAFREHFDVENYSDRLYAKKIEIPKDERNEYVRAIMFYVVQQKGMNIKKVSELNLKTDTQINEFSVKMSEFLSFLEVNYNEVSQLAYIKNQLEVINLFWAKKHSSDDEHVQHLALRKVFVFTEPKNDPKKRLSSYELYNKQGELNQDLPLWYAVNIPLTDFED